MWYYEKKLEYPVNIRRCNLPMAKVVLAQLGGPDGELGAALRYLSQRYIMPGGKTKGLFTDIGTEELSHVELISTMLYQMMEGATPAQLREAGLSAYYTEHGNTVYPSDASGIPFTAASLQSTDDPVTNLQENLAAEQKARTAYEHLMNQTEDPDILAPLQFLREREVIHFQRFGEALNDVQFRQSMKKYH
jgi:spore coat protein JC